MPDPERAIELNSRGQALLDEGDFDGAATALKAAIAADPDLAWAWFNLGLVHKFRRHWEEAFRCNSEAAGRVDTDEGDPAWWNLGICATALRDWATAREAWTRYGIDIPPGEGPLEMDLGYVLVRIRSDALTEVVWSRRIDPARAVILNVPFPESGHRCGDYVLHDGVPNGERTWEGRTYVVFDELERWEASPTPTLIADVVCRNRSDSVALSDVFEQAGAVAEDWQLKVRMLCAACSEGRSHEPHEQHDEPHTWSAERTFGLAAELGFANELLARWRAGAPTRREVSSVRPA